VFCLYPGKNQQDAKTDIDFTVTIPDGTPISAMSDEDQIQVIYKGKKEKNTMDIYTLLIILEM